MIERILRKIILLFYREWNNNTVHTFLLFTLMICLCIINTLLGINFFIAVLISLFVYIALLFINNFRVKEDAIDQTIEADKGIFENKPLNITFIVYLILITFNVWFSTHFPLLIFNSTYSIWWFIFYTVPVFITSFYFTTYNFIMSLKEETNDMDNVD